MLFGDSVDFRRDIFPDRNLLRTRRLLIEKEQALDQIEKQKLELETRDKNMTDSLIYAQRIQEALLPSEDYFRRFFSDSFIFSGPRTLSAVISTG